MTQRQLRHQKLTQAWVTTHENCKPGAHCTGSIRTGWGVSFLHATVHLSLFQIAPLVSIFKYLSWSEVLLGILACLEMYLSCLHCFYMRGKWGNYLLNLVSFRNFLKPLSCLLPELNSFSRGWKNLPPLRTSYCFTSILIPCILSWFPPRLTALTSRETAWSNTILVISFQW